jgi:hypothetical protein
VREKNVCKDDGLRFESVVAVGVVIYNMVSSYDVERYRQTLILCMVLSHRYSECVSSDKLSCPVAVLTWSPSLQHGDRYHG